VKFGIVSDIHGNLEALEAVVRLLREHGARQFICCGDIVGYGPDPNRCVEVVRNLGCTCVAGNHDLAATGSVSTDRFNSAAASAVMWTRPLLSEENRLYLDSLPLTVRNDSLFIVHASPSAPDVWKYVLTTRDAACEMEYCPGPVCIVGHSHVPMVVERLPGKPVRHVRQDEFTLRPGATYFINAGSVGQPRDGDPRACGLLYDSDGPSMTRYRVTYDIAAVQDKMHSAGLPESLASRLESGR